MMTLTPIQQQIMHSLAEDLARTGAPLHETRDLFADMLIDAVLEDTKHNVAKSARLLKIHRNSLIVRMKHRREHAEFSTLQRGRP